MGQELNPDVQAGPEKIISKWGKDDYLKTDAPYKWLYGFKDDAFTLNRMKALMAEAAKKAKVTNFGTIWQGYVADQMDKTGKSLLENVTEFSDQPMELRCGDYACEDSGVYRWDSKAGRITVCAHPIMPVRRLINIDTGEVKSEIAFRRGNAWRCGIYGKSTTSSAQKIVAMADNGVSVSSESARELVKYLAYLDDANYNALPEARSVGRLGWVQDYGFSPYVDGLVFDGNEQYRHAFESVRTAGSAKEWFALARQVRAGKSIVCRCALAASFASVLVGMLDALPFLVHMWGGAGAGKTVGLMLAASVWASPSVGDYVKSFNGTAVANELNAAFCGSLPLCLDELQCIKDRKGFDDIIYMLCEGAGKARGAKSGGLQRVSTWRNCTISTGEMPITSGNSGAGAINRVVELDCKGEHLFDDPRGAVAILTRNYGHAGKQFIEALKSEDVTDTLRETQEAFYAQLSGKATDKQALAASVILTADAMAEMILFEDGIALTVDDLLPYLTTNDAADANRRAYDWLLSVIASNPARFSPTAPGGEYSGECWGCIEEDKRSGGCWAYIIKGVFDRLMADEGYSGESFLSWAARNGMIQRGSTDTQKRRVKRKRMRGVALPVWCVCLAVPNGDGDTVDAEGNTRIDEDLEEQLHV